MQMLPLILIIKILIAVVDIKTTETSVSSSTLKKSLIYVPKSICLTIFCTEFVEN